MNFTDVRQSTIDELCASGVPLDDVAKASVELVDFGLGQIETFGIQVYTYVNNYRYCAKNLVFLPRQICPEHWHPPVEDDPGKMETFFVIKGCVYVYVEGEATEPFHGAIPLEKEPFFTARKEILLCAGEQRTIAQGVKHWFQAGENGATVLEISSACRDNMDVFTDPSIRRV